MSNRKPICVCARYATAILLALSTGKGQINVTVRGTVSDPYGYPAYPCDIKIARMVDGGVTHYSANAMVKSETSEDGPYLVTIGGPGIFKLIVAYPFAQRTEIPLILSAHDTSITCNVRLGEVQVDSLSSLVALGSWNHFSFRYADTLVCSDDTGKTSFDDDPDDDWRIDTGLDHERSNQHLVRFIACRDRRSLDFDNAHADRHPGRVCIDLHGKDVKKRFLP